MVKPQRIPTHPKFVDLSDKEFERLTVLCYVGRSRWLCQCKCGKLKVTSTTALTRHATRSCGCLHKELTGARMRKHGMSETSEFTIWLSIRDRCNNKNCPRYADYGGRGIKVCPEWQESFENFYRGMGPRPSKNHSVERKDNDGDYSSQNCVWATAKQQGRNTRANHYVNFRGSKVSIAELADITGVKYRTILSRILRGFTLEEAITVGSLNRGRQKVPSRKTLITHDGKTRTAVEWAQIRGMKRQTITARLRRGWSDDQAINLPLGAIVQDRRKLYRRATEDNHAATPGSD